MTRMVKILGTGKYLPQREVSAKELAQKIGSTEEWIAKKSGVMTRYFVDNETSAYMGAKAAIEALESAGLKLEDIDAVVSAGGVMQQSIPCTATLIQKELGMDGSGIPAFDINTTCLGFITAFDTLSSMIISGRYKNILIICSDIASVGLDWNHFESCTLFGDGAAAVIIGPTPQMETSKIHSARIETYCEGTDYCQIEGGGTKLHPRDHSKGIDKRFLFQMDGRAVFKLASKKILPFMTRLLQAFCLKDISLFIPHQASVMAIRILKQKLGLDDTRIINIASKFGNMIAASIPFALHQAIQQKKVKRGDRLVLFGTSAGFSIGGLVLEY